MLIPKRGEAINTNKVGISTKNCFFDSNIMGLKVSKEFDINYVAYFLLARTLSDLIDKSTVPQINNKHIKPLIVPFPPKEEQEKISKSILEKTKKISVLIRKINSEIQKLEEYRQSLISNAVTGKIDVRQEVIAQ